jgi:hypothetical protein
MRRCRLLLPPAVLLLVLSGCAALPDTTLGHRCGIPKGVGCLSTQEVYERTVTGSLPGLEREPRDPSRETSGPGMRDSAPHVLRTSALYAPPEELRIWVNRWRDADGDLHDDAFLYVLIGEGQWLVRD